MKKQQLNNKYLRRCSFLILIKNITVIYPYNGILLCNTKEWEWSIKICNDLDSFPENHTEWKKLIPKVYLYYGSIYITFLTALLRYNSQIYISLRVHSSLVFSIVTEFCNHHHNLVWYHFCHTKETLYLLFFFPGGIVVKNLPAVQETQVQSLGWEDPLEKKMSTHSSILAWEIPWTEEPGGLKSMGLQKSQTQVSDLTTTTYIYVF